MPIKDRNRKIAEFIRREVLWFIIGAEFSAFVSFGLGAGDWLSKQHLFVLSFIAVCGVLVWFFSKRSAKQR